MRDLPLKSSLLISALVLVSTPLAFGGVHPLTLLIFKLLVLAAFLTSIYLIIDKRIEFRNRIFNYALVLFAIIVLTQLFPLPANLLKLFMWQRYDLLFGSFPQLGIPVPGFHPISLNPASTRAAFSNYLFFCALYLTFSSLASDRKSIKFLSTTLIGTGFLVAFIAIAQKFSDAPGIYWGVLRRVRFYGTFVNPNHCAVFISAAAAFTLPHFLKEKVKSLKFFYGFLFSIMSIAVFYSLSRGAILSFLTVVILSAFIFFRARENHADSIKGMSMPLGLLFVAMILLMLWWGTFGFFGEMGTLRGISADNYRLQLWKNSLEIFSDFFLFGTGLGSFSDVIPLYRTFFGNVTVEFAENDYLQILAETGVCGFLVAVWIGMETVKRVLKITLKKFTEIPKAQLGAALGIICIALDSFVSFNFYIPGIMSQACLLLALLFIPSRRYG